jgi:hypothetical protein
LTLTCQNNLKILKNSLNQRKKNKKTKKNLNIFKTKKQKKNLEHRVEGTQYTIVFHQVKINN